MADRSPPYLPGPTPIERLLAPFQRFAETEASGGIVLLAATLVALAWSNSPWRDSYFALWHSHAGVSLGGWVMDEQLHEWINHGLMAVFFFLVGLEIKREAMYGELAGVRRAAPPVFAALGGMLLPAALYMAVNLHGAGADGWGIPMATDIAFALGVLALFGRGVPAQLRLFLTALAIADDIGAVLVIALFFTHSLNLLALAAAGLIVLALAGLNAAGVRRPGVYAAVGVLLWLAVQASGLHATIAGILLAMAVPASTRIQAGTFLQHNATLLEEFRSAGTGAPVPRNAEQQETLRSIVHAAHQAQAPLQRIENRLHGWVAFGIVPLFALANAGVDLRGTNLGSLVQPVTLGILLGLVVGKPLGILGATWVGARLAGGGLPDGISWRGLRAIGPLGGIGFTMSLFIATLAFGDRPLLADAKVGVLAASALSALLGWLGLMALRRPGHGGPTGQSPGGDLRPAADASSAPPRTHGPGA
jgi:NhaA family Na+:H+ antiporter